MARKPTWEAPIGNDGSLLAYPYRSRRCNSQGEWVDTDQVYVPNDTTWLLTLTFDSFDKGERSAYRFIGTDPKGGKWPMSISQYVMMAKQLTIKKCKVSGRFGVVKRGQNYSLTYLGKA